LGFGLRENEILRFEKKKLELRSQTQLQAILPEGRKIPENLKYGPFFIPCSDLGRLIAQLENN
jgi:hypothetical protein